VNSYQLTADPADTFGGYFSSSDWHDTLIMPSNAISVRFQSDRYTGKQVIHCHILEHEDEGMMLVTQLTGTEGTLFTGAEAIESGCTRGGPTASPQPSPPPLPPYPPPETTADNPCFERETTTACRVTDPQASPLLAYRHCFGEGAASATSAVAERVLMSALSAGDLVLDGEAAITRVVVNQHVPPGKLANMVTIHDSAGPVLTVTPDHVILVDGKFGPARDASPGAVLSSGRAVTSSHTSLGGIINPLTATGTILAAHGLGEPVIASTASEWSADIVLSAYPPYTLSFAASFAFPQQVQAYYDLLLEPTFSTAVPYMVALKAAVPPSLVFPIAALLDVLLLGGFAAFSMAKFVLLPTVALALGGVAVRVSSHKKK